MLMFNRRLIEMMVTAFYLPFEDAHGHVDAISDDEPKAAQPRGEYRC